MNNTFYFLGFEQFVTKDNNTIVKISILDLKNKNVHNIYKSFSKDLVSRLDNIKVFDNISNSITFVIKRNGTIALDIK